MRADAAGHGPPTWPAPGPARRRGSRRAGRSGPGRRHHPGRPHRPARRPRPCTEAAVQSASLYAHFPSKQAILAELVLAGHEEHHARLGLVTALLECGTDPRDRLAALVRAHVQAHTDYPMLAVVANNEMHALSPAAAGPRRC
ncbi:MAG TPA: hypothetical protein VEH31_34255 [Streptosporangiaceae bacterium]|nr:hypothetical protein [Streptosporangiaceae bacterium]